MKRRIKDDLKTATDNNFVSVSEVLTELSACIKNSNKETVDVCNDLLLQYKDRIENVPCNKDRIVYTLKYNVLSRYTKE